MLDRLRSQSISRQFLLVMVMVALLPMAVLGFHLYQSAWEDSWREIREKHQLLAQNLAAPLSSYVNDHRGMLSLLAESVFVQEQIKPKHVRQLLGRAVLKTDGFSMLVLLDMNGRVIARSDGVLEPEVSDFLFSTEQCYLMTRKTGEWTISRVKRSPFTKQPTIFMGYPVVDKQGKNVAVLLGELRIDYIEKIRRNVKFGKLGHSAIVDKTGHVIAHPNPDWMSEIKDLSHWPIVQAMIAGRTGVTSFYSPFMKGNMVAGYAAVPEIGWGIMVPQPESEVAAQVNALMFSHLVWGIAGLIMAIALAILIARWITRPINKLASDSHVLMGNDLRGELPAVATNAPSEVQQLGQVVQSLVSRLQNSRDEVIELNTSLQEKIDQATQQLRESNEQLEEAVRKDQLTNLANRHHFESSLSQALSRRSGDIDHVCVMLIDIDEFKQINDSYSHAAGDRVLGHVAGILERSMRQGDLVARYGGDEFVAYMRCTHDIGTQRASEIRKAIMQSAVPWDNKSIHITASIGLYCQRLGDVINVGEILDKADGAMYEAKQQGRNRVVDRKH